MDFVIAPASTDDADALHAIERAAQQLFRGHPAWPACMAEPMEPRLLLDAITAGRVWVAREAAGRLVGFVAVAIAEDEAAIAELDVLPDCGRRGIGAALLEHACDWIAESGYPVVVLGTFSDVAWNAPFYEHHGFATIPPAAYTPALAAHHERDRERGMPMHLRVYMRRVLSPAPHGWTRWPAPAKLNLFLRITGRRADGYHELQTVFRLLDWGDELRLRVRADGELRRVTEVPGVSADSDLMLRAARLLKTHAGCALGADIGLEKRIPMGGGLGGGSSDAATVLVALNQLWGCALDEDTLAELGRQLGADVPVFVRGRSAWAEGVGERLTPLALPRRHYVVLDPREHVPTAALFQAPELTRNAPQATISSFVSGEAAENAFTPVVRARHPRVAAALDWLDRHGPAKLSGSGGCVFLELRSLDRAYALAARCPGEFDVHVASGVSHSPLLGALGRHGGGPHRR